MSQNRTIGKQRRIPTTTVTVMQQKKKLATENAASRRGDRVRTESSSLSIEDRGDEQAKKESERAQKLHELLYGAVRGQPGKVTKGREREETSEEKGRGRFKPN